MARTVFILLLLLAGFLSASAYGDRLDLGGKRIELVDGNVPDEVAKEVLAYAENLYARGEYDSARGILEKLRKNYRGPELAAAHFLWARTLFMLNRDQEGGGSFNRPYSGWDRAYTEFLTIFDSYRTSHVVTSNELQNTVQKATMMIKDGIIESEYKKLYPDLTHMIRYSELYKYMTKKPVPTVDSFLSATYSDARKGTAIDDLAKAAHSCRTDSSGKSRQAWDVANCSQGYGVVVQTAVARLIIPELEYLYQHRPIGDVGVHLERQWGEYSCYNYGPWLVRERRSVGFPRRGFYTNEGRRYIYSIDGKTLREENAFAHLTDVVGSLESEILKTGWKFEISKAKHPRHVYSLDLRFLQEEGKSLWSMKCLQHGIGGRISALELMKVPTLESLLLATHGSVYEWAAIKTPTKNL